MRSLLSLLSLFALNLLDARAQDSTASEPKPTLNVTRLRGTIEIDGNIDDAGWRTAAHVTSFTSALPIPGHAAIVQTEGYLTYDDDNLYVAMIAHDPDPSAIGASRVPRDRIFNDDFMGIILDTYGDATKAFELYVNPRGIEGDLFWTATNEDMSYDLIYDAEAEITDSGWQMEMRIPFSSLRFPERSVQDFHMTFWRNYPRASVYKFSWSPMNFGVPCAFCQLGDLTGIENIRSSGTLDLLPALVTSQIAHEPHVDDRLTNDDPTIKPSLTARLSLGTATALEAAVKPDFSQVEADAAQVTANATFALFYPEHRPFFQDGSDLWNTFLSAVYTRSMGSPIAAAKVLHRDENSSYAYLASYDETTPVIIPLEERSVIVEDEHKSLSNILRATHTFDDDRYLGVLATDRRYYGDGFNTVFGVDGRWRLFENVALQGQQLVSLTREPNTGLVAGQGNFDNGRHTVAWDAERFTGNANVIAIERYTPGFDFHVEYSQTSPAFRAGDGFMSANDSRMAYVWIGNKLPLEDPPSWAPWLVELDGSLSLSHNWNYEGASKLDRILPRLDFAFKGQTDLHVSYQLSNERFANVLFERLPLWRVDGSTHFYKSIVLSWSGRKGEGIYYDPSQPSRGKLTVLTLNGQFKPLDGLMIEPAYTFTRLDSMSGDGQYFSGSIYWTRLTYQFTRQLDLRVITQYDGFGQHVIIDPLLTYKINPFTSFYVGSAHNFIADDTLTHLRATDRQFFAKLQYLIQT